MRAIGLLVTAALLINAEAAAARPAADIPPRDPPITADSRSEEVTRAIAKAVMNVKRLRDGLPPDIEDQRTKQTWFDSSIILLGVASVAGALYRASLPAIGGIGLAAEGLNQYRAYYNPQGVGAGYIAAEKATRCVYSSAEPLLTEQPQLLWSRIRDLRLAIARAQASASELDNTTDAGQAGTDAATQAINAANSALTSLTNEATAYSISPSVIDGAHDSIKNYIDKVRQRTPPNYGTVSSQLNAAINSQAASTAQAAAARAQLLTAYQAQAKAQAAVGGGGNPTPQPAVTPESLTASGQLDPQDAAKVEEVAASAARSALTAARINAGEVSALITETATALNEMPSPAYTQINTTIGACVAGLS
jgi:hypothetical protein